MNIKPICVSYNINRKFGYNATEVISIECEEDFKTRYIDVYLYADNVRNTVDISGSTVTARMVTTPEYDSLLLSDNVACEVAGTGHIIIPIDSAVIAAYPCDFLVEVHIQNGENVLVLPFPLWVSMRASILDNAGVTPESQGTVPKLLKDATKTLEDAEAAIENAGDYDNLENKPSINGVTLDGNKTTEELNIETGGTDDYNELNNKPAFVFSRLFQNDLVIPISGRFKLINFRAEQNENITNISLDGVDGSIITSGTAYYEIFRKSIRKAIVRDYGEYTHPPYNLFTSSSTAPDYNSIYHISQSNLSGLPVAEAGLWINYYVNAEHYQLYFTDTTKKLYYRNTYMGAYSSWQEIGAGVTVSSAVVNQNGTITFTMSDGSVVTTTGESVIGPKGDNYNLTNQDKSDIADIVLGELPTTQGVLYGN